MSNNMTDCSATRELSLSVKSFVVDIRLTAILFLLTLINISLHYLQTRLVPSFSASSRFPPEVNEEVAVRILQLVIGTMITLAGIALLLYQAISGCNANEFFVFVFGGLPLLSLDVHEYVRRWPLRAALLGHHLTVFIMGLVYIEFELLPKNKDAPVNWTTVAALTCIGIGWISDFFHVVFRASTSLRLIESFRIVYLCLASFRVAFVALAISITVRQGLDEAWIGVVGTSLLTAAFVYNTYKAITFVLRFDCGKCFLAHQAKWAEAGACNEEGGGVDHQSHRDEVEPLGSRPHTIQNIRTPTSLAAGSKASESLQRLRSGKVSIQKSQTQPLPDTQGGGERRRRWQRKSVLAMLAIDVEAKCASVQAGLRGDVQGERDLQEYLSAQGSWTSKAGLAGRRREKKGMEGAEDREKGLQSHQGDAERQPSPLEDDSHHPDLILPSPPPSPNEEGVEADEGHSNPFLLGTRARSHPTEVHVTVHQTTLHKIQTNPNS
uniref:Uncharacterized protein n=1 Tax=Chromera velia CCMP2878 TaxID=1169474 RepID=A0A0G4HBN6_9ALVE|eukprot:Cvel_25871.t1-p1 / transcript=Cvel_25871.t1 / gene=Cvel_25871 / organism=Chromera_velia_CCMP2878 / gene_product=hypothetical protein / transcript_product=hypothetical protein / location=Cvel_scaffold2985:19363-20841(-) / protein_length=493 / sequence_SO=supercontig / SO=protein_coding / is_pseudo=false